MDEQIKKPYRLGVVAVIQNKEGKLLLGKRTDNGAWQFPQGGIDKGESFAEALLREVQEEVGLTKLSIIRASKNKVRYHFPKELKRNFLKDYAGQEQVWFLCEAKEDDSPDLKKASCHEFTSLTWQDIDFVLAEVVYWKKEAYRQGLQALGFKLETSVKKDL